MNKLTFEWGFHTKARYWPDFGPVLAIIFFWPLGAHRWYNISIKIILTIIRETASIIR